MVATRLMEGSFQKPATSGGADESGRGWVCPASASFPGNGISPRRDRWPKIGSRPKNVSAETKTPTSKPANCGPLASLWEIHRFEKVRGGRGSHNRTGLCHQNSLLTGKLTGNFADSGVVPQVWLPCDQQLQWLAVTFPIQKNRPPNQRSGSTSPCTSGNEEPKPLTDL
jgi:hypothetical protein